MMNDEGSSPNIIDEIIAVSNNKEMKSKQQASRLISSSQTNKTFLNLFSDSDESASDESIDIDDSSIFLSNEVIHDSNEISIFELETKVKEGKKIIKGLKKIFMSHA
jgi:hypothetical protein